MKLDAIRHNRSKTVKALPKVYWVKAARAGSDVFLQENWVEKKSTLVVRGKASRLLLCDMFPDECAVPNQCFKH